MGDFSKSLLPGGPPVALADPEIARELIQMEQAVLCGMMQSREATMSIAPALKPRDFVQGSHILIYEACVALADAGKPVSVETVLDKLIDLGTLDQMGGGVYLHTCWQLHTIPAEALHLAGKLRGRAQLRELEVFGAQLTQRARGPAVDFDEVALWSGDRLAEIQLGGTIEEVLSAADILPHVIDALENQAPPRGVRLPYTDLAAIVPRLKPGRLVIIAARPAVGKSTMAIDIGREVAVRQHGTVVIFSLEMDSSELMHRVLAAEALVDLQCIEDKTLNDDLWARLNQAFARVSPAPLYIDDEPNTSVARIRLQVAGMIRAGNTPDLVIVDFIQLIEPVKAESREQQVSQMSRQLKLLARELDIPVVVCAQLNRGPEQRADKRPLLSDLRESGALEQNADLVILIHRPELYDEHTEQRGIAEAIVAKQRQGRTGVVELGFQGEYARLVDLARQTGFDEVKPPERYERPDDRDDPLDDSPPVPVPAARPVRVA